MHFPQFLPIVLASLPLLTTATGSIGCTSKTQVPSLSLHRREEDWQKPWETTKMVGSTVKVYWNIIYKDNTREGGYISDKEIAEQMKVLNEDYAPVGIDFVMGADPIRTNNPAWFNFAPGDRKTTEAFKGSTKIMERAALKIWTVSPDHVGFSYPPDPSSYLDPLYDGVIYPISSFPNSPGMDAQGHLLTHEVGHWSGLNHTFDEQTGCSVDPDSVLDTPKQEKPTNTCSEEVFSCGNKVPDAAHNYMNYVPDECRKEFSPGQIDLMHKILKGYRGITPGAGTKTPTGDSRTKASSGSNNGTETPGSSSAGKLSSSGGSGSRIPGALRRPTRSSGMTPPTNPNSDADSSSTTSSGGNADTGGNVETNNAGSSDVATQVDQLTSQLEDLQTKLADIQAKVKALQSKASAT